MKKVRVCSLFSGIGGFETGIFNALGKENVEVVFASEIDKHASNAYKTIYKHTPHGDITKIHEKDIPDHDILVGGFPCQSFSLAGLRGGFSDTRGTLFFEIARIAKEKRPKVMVLENVKGLVSHDKGKTLEVIIQTLSDLDYKVDFRILNSKRHGVAQNRERIFIIAMLEVEKEAWELPKETNTLRKIKKNLVEMKNINTFNFRFPKENDKLFKLADVLESVVDEKYYMSLDKSIDLIKALEVEYAGKKTIHKKENTNDLKLLGMLEMKGNDSIRRVYDIEGIAPTLTTMGGGHREPKIAVVEPHTVIENGIEVIYQHRIRKLTPLECFKVQGFPISYYDALKEAKVSDTQLYKMAGNAVTTNLISDLFQQIHRYI